MTASILEIRNRGRAEWRLWAADVNIILIGKRKTSRIVNGLTHFRISADMPNLKRAGICSSFGEFYRLAWGYRLWTSWKFMSDQLHLMYIGLHSDGSCTRCRNTREVLVEICDDQVGTHELSPCKSRVFIGHYSGCNNEKKRPPCKVAALGGGGDGLSLALFSVVT